MLEFERALPQHNPGLPFPEGRKGRYVIFPPVPLGLDILRSYIKFSAHAWGSSWNNVVQEQCVAESFSPPVEQSW